MKNKLVIISGASRGIGKAFLDKYKTLENVIPIGISRSGKTEKVLYLEDEAQSFDFIKNLNIKNIYQIDFMHSIGIDKFEQDSEPHIDLDGDGIDDEIYKTNVSYFLNLAQPLIARAKENNLPLSIINIGSISDAFNVPFWRSFSESKNLVRRFCKSIHDGKIKSLMINVSSILDEEGRTYGREHADTTYWLPVQELVERAFPLVERLQSYDTTYQEADFYKANPFYRSDHFEDLPRLLFLWQNDLGYVGEKIPKGIRI